MAQSANLTFFGCFPISSAKIMLYFISCMFSSIILWLFKVKALKYIKINNKT